MRIEELTKRLNTAGYLGSPLYLFPDEYQEIRELLDQLRKDERIPWKIIPEGVVIGPEVRIIYLEDTSKYQLSSCCGYPIHKFRQPFFLGQFITCTKCAKELAFIPQQELERT